MTPQQIAKLRQDMDTNEYCFGRIFDATPVQIVCWEDGRELPNSRQEMLMQYARRAVDLALEHDPVPDFADIYTTEAAVKALAWILRHGEAP